MKPQMYIRANSGASFASDFRPKVRILKTGGVVLNQSAMTTLGLGPDPSLHHQELIFYWYPDTSSLGFRRAATGQMPSLLPGIRKEDLPALGGGR